MAEDQRLTPGAGSLLIACSERVDDITGNHRVSLWGFDGANWNRARVNSAGELLTSSSGGGGGGTVDQGAAGTDPWLIKIDQTGTNNDVNVAGTVTVADDKAEDSPHASGDTGSFILGVRNDAGATLTDANGDYSPIAVNLKGQAQVVISDVTSAASLPVAVQNTVTVAGTVSVTEPVSVDDNGGSLTVDGPLTDAQLRATPVPVDTELTTKDYDTGAGTDTVAVVGILLPASGGSVAGGTATNPIRTDPTGTTIQPVSGTVTADTELPAAAALADDTANPTVPAVGSFSMEYDGSEANWDRVRHSYKQTRNSVSGTGAGTTVDMTECAMSKFSIMVIATSAATYSVALEISLDGTNWFTGVLNTSLAGTSQIVFSIDKPVTHMRSNVVSITGGGASLNITILASAR